MRISDWSSDVCSSDLKQLPPIGERLPAVPLVSVSGPNLSAGKHGGDIRTLITRNKDVRLLNVYGYARLMAYDETLEIVPDILEWLEIGRAHAELQSLMRISYAVFCLKTKKTNKNTSRYEATRYDHTKL